MRDRSMFNTDDRLNSLFDSKTTEARAEVKPEKKLKERSATPTSFLIKKQSAWGKYRQEMIAPMKNYHTAYIQLNLDTMTLRSLIARAFISPYLEDEKKEAFVQNWSSFVYEKNRAPLSSAPFSLPRLFNPFKLLLGTATFFQYGIGMLADKIFRKKGLKSHPIAKLIKMVLGTPFALLSWVSRIPAKIELLPPIVSFLKKRESIRTTAAPTQKIHEKKVSIMSHFLVRAHYYRNAAAQTVYDPFESKANKQAALQPIKNAIDKMREELSTQPELQALPKKMRGKCENLLNSIEKDYLQPIGSATEEKIFLHKASAFKEKITVVQEAGVDLSAAMEGALKNLEQSNKNKVTNPIQTKTAEPISRGAYTELNHTTFFHNKKAVHLISAIEHEHDHYASLHNLDAKQMVKLCENEDTRLLLAIALVGIHLENAPDPTAPIYISGIPPLSLVKDIQIYCAINHLDCKYPAQKEETISPTVTEIDNVRKKLFLSPKSLKEAMKTVGITQASLNRIKSLAENRKTPATTLSKSK